ncbi:MAG: hypothetical protein LIP12_04155 [Clostridiales bacterium]|nr:hypothetical protein [Clostridiales bacterium]
MSEYKRFVAYFYEYIDGKKQKNAGFAKVELRDGLWRVLFRLTPVFDSMTSVHVYGFVREGNDLLGLPLGMLNGEDNEKEDHLIGNPLREWAWSAREPLGGGNYTFDQLNGIYMLSSDGRIFATVWDDEEVDLSRFVLKPLAAGRNSENQAERELPNASSDEIAPIESQGMLSEQMFSSVLESAQTVPEAPHSAQAVPAASESARTVPATPHSTQAVPAILHSVRKDYAEKTRPQQNPAEMLLHSRQHFQPFHDDEFAECVQIRLCDLTLLQQNGWQVGRNNFLQHGYYQYRHLLFGRRTEGGYVLGVPSLYTPQEEYMAGIFDFKQFKLSNQYQCGRKFGYWYRILKKAEERGLS